MFRVYKITGRTKDEGVSIKREVLHRRSLKEDRVFEVDSTFARKEWRECRWSLIIEVTRRVHELKCCGIKTLKQRVQATAPDVDSRRMHFF